MEAQRAAKREKEERNFRAFEAMLAQAHEVRGGATAVHRRCAIAAVPLWCDAHLCRPLSTLRWRWSRSGATRRAGS